MRKQSSLTCAVAQQQDAGKWPEISRETKWVKETKVLLRLAAVGPALSDTVKSISLVAPKVNKLGFLCVCFNHAIGFWCSF